MDASPEAAVVALCRRVEEATLCSAHAAHAGWPYGSLVPYALTDSGDFVVWLADIAEHTRNLQAEPRATLLVADPGYVGQGQAGPRNAVMVRAAAPTGARAEAAETAYFGRYPEAAALRHAHGFRAWVLVVERVRWIAGFGSMGWLSGDEWRAAVRAN